MPYSAAMTMNFFGTQPMLTQVPPQNRLLRHANACAVARGDAPAADACRTAANYE